jgi:hypothetical protein
MATHESLFYHLKSNGHMLINGLYLFSSLMWMKKATINVLKITIDF